MPSQHALFVLPMRGRGCILDRRLKRWLSKGEVTFESPECESLLRVLSVIGARKPSDGLGALRFWGQTGDRSASWMAAADPVHLEARLRDLRVRTLSGSRVSHAELRAVFATLQTELGAAGEMSFAQFGGCGYLHSVEPMDVPVVSSVVANGYVPDQFTSSGNIAKRYHGLLGEMQMLLHDHEVNRQRQEKGQPVINSLWFWGGGVAPEPAEQPLPALYSDDPLFCGYWKSCLQNTHPWSGVAECIADASQSLVAVVPESRELGAEADDLQAVLGMLEDLQRSGAVGNLSLLFRDGLEIMFGRLDRFKFWRRASACLEENTVE